MGFLIPPWYESEIPNRSDLNDASLVLGATIPLAVFTCVKNAMQTNSIFERRRTFTPFVLMCWAEWAASVALAILSYLFLSGHVEASFWTFFFLISLWVVEMQCILQIIINRVALIASNPTQVRRIRILVFVIASAINLTGYPIWIPARLQLTPYWRHINFWWDRSEKVLYALVDIALNGYFMYQVRTKLIQMGLTKYKKLLYANIAMACVSVGMDILVLGSMSLPSDVIYAQFHPLQFLVKLLIELFMADLIAKIVREDNRINTIAANGFTDTGGTTADEMHAIMAINGGEDSFARGLEMFGNTHMSTDSGGLNSADVEAGDGGGTHHHMHRKTAVIEVAGSGRRGGRTCGEQPGSRGLRRDRPVTPRRGVVEIDAGREGDIADEYHHHRRQNHHHHHRLPHPLSARGIRKHARDKSLGRPRTGDLPDEEKGDLIPEGVIVQTTTTVVTTEDAEPPMIPEWYASLYAEIEAERIETMRAIQACENGELNDGHREEDTTGLLQIEHRSHSAPP